MEMDILLDEHLLNLESKACEFRSRFLSEVNEELATRLDDNEREKCLNRFWCIYSEMYQSTIWQEHGNKSFEEFAQWYYVDGGGSLDWQGVQPIEFSRVWALNWMLNWSSQQVVDICSRRIDNMDRKPFEVRADSLIPSALTSASSIQSDENLLTQRERVLIHCYQQKPAIVRGHPDYQDYMRYARPSDRTGYPNDSVRKAKLLIRSIRKILPHLTKNERQQAESEINTIESIFCNQL